MGNCSSAANCGAEGLRCAPQMGKNKQVPSRAQSRFLNYNADGQKLKPSDQELSGVRRTNGASNGARDAGLTNGAPTLSYGRPAPRIAIPALRHAATPRRLE